MSLNDIELLTDPEYNFSKITPIPVFQSRGERDRLTTRTADCNVKDRYELNKIDREENRIVRCLGGMYT